MKIAFLFVVLLPLVLAAARPGMSSYKAARDALGRKQPEEALLLLDRAAAEGKNDAWLWTARGQACFQLARLVDAAAACDSALFFDAGSVSALVLRARVRLLQHRLAEAETDLAGALALRPDDVFACGLYAGVLERRGRREAGYVYRERAAMLAGQNPAVLVSAGYAALALDRPRDAGDWFERALSCGADAAVIAPVCGAARLRHAASLRLAGRIDEAVVVLARIVARFPLGAEAKTAAAQMAALARLRATAVSEGGK